MASENIRNNINFVYYILCIDLNRAVNPFLAITFGERHRLSAIHAHTQRMVERMSERKNEKTTEERNGEFMLYKTSCRY